MNKKYCETLTPGYYLINTSYCNRCVYITGSLKGNKWIDLDVPNPQWMSLLWNCINKDGMNTFTFHNTNPTAYNI